MYFSSHYANDPIVPGVILIESLAQAFTMTFLCIDDYKSKTTSMLSASNVKFARKVVPGDMLVIKSTLDILVENIARGKSEGFINGELACSAELVVSIRDHKQNSEMNK